MTRRISFVFLALLLAACSQKTPPGSSGSVPPTLTGLTLSVPSLTLNVGDSATVEAIFQYSDGTTKPANSGVYWKVGFANLVQLAPDYSNGTVAITGKIGGVTDLTATYGSYEATIPLTVVRIYTSLLVDPNPLWIPPEFQAPLSAWAVYNDGTTTLETDASDWSMTGDPALGAVSNALGTKGLFVATKSGQVLVNAIHDGISGQATVNIMPIRLIGWDGIPLPAPNNLLRRPLVTIDGSNRGTATWAYQISGEVFAGGHDGTDWTPRAQVNSTQSPSDWVMWHKIASNEAGARVIVWAGTQGMYAVYASAGGDFGDAQTVPTGLASFYPDFAGLLAAGVTKDGEGLAVWKAGTSTVSTYISRYSPVTKTWADPELIGGFPARYAAFNANGDAVLVWTLEEGTPSVFYIYSSIYHSGTGATAPAILATTSIVSYVTSLSINDNGEAIVVWSTDPPGVTTESEIHAALYRAADGWFFNDALPKGSSVRGEMGISAINDSGDILVGWTDSAQNYTYVIRYDDTLGWHSPDVISDVIGLGTAVIQTLALDSSGNAICIYADGTSYAQTPFKYRRLPHGGTWGDPVTLQNVGRVGNPGDSLTASYNKAGNGIMAWETATSMPNGTGGLYSIGYNFMELAPPIQ